MTRARLWTVTAAILALAPAAALALPFGAEITRIDGPGPLRFEVEVYAAADALDPPDQWLLRRRNTAPKLDGPLLMADWTVFPAPGDHQTQSFTDGDVAGLGVGIYEVRALWDDGRELAIEAASLSLVEHPYLMRGTLVSEIEVEACAGIDLLECSEVELTNLDWWQDIGPGVLLDIYGWPVRLEGQTNCKVLVTWVEVMPPDANCDSPMATDRVSWSAVRALYR